MADYEDPQKPKDEHISIGDQPTDVEEIRFGKGPGEGEMTPLPDLGGHPRGLWVLFITEMWERFSYYGMRGLLALFLAASTTAMINGEANDNPGFGWTEAEASLLYGVYTFMVYLTSIFGGIVADRLLGTNRSMLVGGWVIAAGHIMLAFSSFFSYQPGLPVSPDTAPGALYSFLSGLALIIIGTGFFKPCVSVMVGQLYSEGDERRDSGFTLFYMGINLGSLLSYLVAGTRRGRRLALGLRLRRRGHDPRPLYIHVPPSKIPPRRRRPAGAQQIAQEQGACRGLSRPAAGRAIAPARALVLRRPATHNGRVE